MVKSLTDIFKREMFTGQMFSEQMFSFCHLTVRKTSIKKVFRVNGRMKHFEVFFVSVQLNHPGVIKVNVYFMYLQNQKSLIFN